MTALFQLRPALECRYDVVSLGEVMLRLDPGEGRIRTARSFRLWEGGGEYNVARGLRKCFGLRSAVVTALVDNEIGRLIEDLILQGGVDSSWIRWCPHDGVGLAVRNGLNFTERGYGVRGAIGVSDRARSAASQLAPGDVDWDRLFGADGARWLHTGGVFAGLSPTSGAVIEEAMRAARRHGTVVSYDLNYRPSLWQAAGGMAKAQEVNRRLVPLADVLLGNEEDFSACLGFDLPAIAAPAGTLETTAFRQLIAQVTGTYTAAAVVAATLRVVRTATVNDWGAVAWSRPDGFTEPNPILGLEILDRVGGGDSFAAGLIYGLLTGAGLARAAEYGLSHGALAMTTPGDTSMAALSEVERLMSGAGARVRR
jgi:2-dehydro-3-deoxygluconokinase